LLALIEVAFPAVSQSKPVMEELVGFRSWNLEADKAFALDDGLVTLTAAESCSTFQKSPPLCLVPLFGTNPARRERFSSTTANFLVAHGATLRLQQKNGNGRRIPPLRRVGPLLS